MNLNPLLTYKPSVYQLFRKKLLLFLGFVALLATAGQAQELDTSFDSKIDGVGTDNQISVSVIQSDGKVLIAGPFTRVKGVARNGVARLHADGSLDTTFDPGTGINAGAVKAMVQQADGKILLAGTFTSVNGAIRNRIARLHADGSLDTGYTPNINNNIEAMHLHTGGKVLIGGFFTSVNSVSRSRIARLHPDGTLDTGFDGGTIGGNVLALTVQPDNKIIMGGSFTSVAGIAYDRVSRLNLNGSPDAEFAALIPGVNNNVTTLALQSDGKVVIGGTFTLVAGTPRNRLARLHANGSHDTSFTPGTGANAAVHSVAVQADQSIVAAGLFTSFNGVSRSYLVRLAPSGALDAGFNPTFDNSINTVAVTPAGGLVVSGSFTSINGSIRNLIARLNNDGTVAADFSLSPDVVSHPNVMVTLPSGKILIGGPFVTVHGVERRRIARLNADGSLDTTFDPGSGANNAVTALAVQADGKILVGGLFTQFNGLAYNRIVRLNANGSLDSSFDPGTGPDNQVAAIVVQPGDGHILIGGSFTSVRGVSRGRIARLTPTGGLDESFDPGTGTSGPVLALALQANGKVLAGGSFSSVNSVSWNNIARFDTNGALDSGFGIGMGNDTGFNSAVYALAVQANGKILVGGAFNRALGTNANRVVRLNDNGTLDSSFNPAGAGANGTVQALVLQANGKILIGGAFTTYNNTARNRVARLQTDGTFDTGFTFASPSNVAVSNLALQADHLVLIGRQPEMAVDPAGRALTRIIAKERQTITFAALPNKTYGDPAFSLTATASSGLPVSFSIVSGPATLNGSTLTLTGAGTVRVKAAQAGNEAFYAATDVEQSFEVAKAAQTITFAALAAKTFGEAAFALSATASSNLPVSYTVVSGPATVDGNTLTLTGAGEVKVKASQPGNANYLPAPDVERTITVNKAAQAITFAELENKTFGNEPFSLTATASSGLPVSFMVVSGPASLNGTTLTLTGAGTVVVKASQPGNGNYLPATDVERTFTVSKAAQVITFAALADKTIGDAPFLLSATASSELPVSFTVVSGPATLDGNTLTLTGAGDVTIKASQAGDEYYLAAADVERVFTVRKETQTITFAALEPKTYGAAAFDLAASASSGLPVSFSIVSGPATLSGNTLTLTGAGNVVVKASQAGNERYQAAGEVEQTLVVNKASQSITFAALENKTFGDADFALVATASSELPVGFVVVSGPATLLVNTLSLTGAGEVTVKATQPGNENYLAATEVTRTFCVAPAKPVVTAVGNTLTSSSATGNQWYLNGTAIAGAVNQIFVAETNGAYTVVVRAGACASVASEAQSVTLTTLKPAVQAAKVQVYPNPATTELKLLGTGLGSGTASITLMDLSGRKVLHQEKGLVANQLDLGLEVSSLPRGTYLLQVQSRAGSVISRVVLQ